MEHTFAWPDQIQGAVSLTYDDGLPIHHIPVDPLLRCTNSACLSCLGQITLEHLQIDTESLVRVHELMSCICKSAAREAAASHAPPLPLIGHIPQYQRGLRLNQISYNLAAPPIGAPLALADQDRPLPPVDRNHIRLHRAAPMAADHLG